MVAERTQKVQPQSKADLLYVIKPSINKTQPIFTTMTSAFYQGTLWGCLEHFCGSYLWTTTKRKTGLSQQTDIPKFKNQSMVPKNALNVYFGTNYTITSDTSSSFIPCTIKLVFTVVETRIFACTVAQYIQQYVCLLVCS